MPRGTSRTNRKASAKVVSDPILIESEAPSVSTDTDTDTDPGTFQLDIQPMPDGYKPDRSPAGRTRTPSIFEPVLLGYKGRGWQKQAHDGNVTDDGEGKAIMTMVKEGKTVVDPTFRTSSAYTIKREIQKAQHFLGLGMDILVTCTDVEFNVRDLQKRKAKVGEVGDLEGNIVDENDDYVETEDE